MALHPKVANFLAIFLVMWACLFLILAFVLLKDPQQRALILGSVLTSANIIIVWFFRRKINGNGDAPTG
jgi:LytS/YehU family sensor histidine kinase